MILASFLQSVLHLVEYKALDKVEYVTMSNLFLQDFHAYDEPFSCDDFNMLDEVLDDFISIEHSTTNPKPSFLKRLVNTIYVLRSQEEPMKPKIVVHLCSDVPQTQTKLMLIVRGLLNSSQPPGYIYNHSKQITNPNQVYQNVVAHTYNT